ncbi:MULTISPECIES: ABC transporter permease [Micromonospora]|uniref:ABC transporter permease n=1 Tax=Micromonospora aurantiaca (nom. illeg.) TaxID=47850 RepID=A0ABQ6U831_9ACTN|nr:MULTISPECIES: ABC transporter permease [Micromonospora]ADL48912.1 binding-protein-dependent transport systems inner membrane component [Micromonospora aurantiaca ATCC 27029]KAB1103075.1 ABC transporter permease [Micromonospora aurantiaca]MDG4754199.1 ABC transporter permease [Micromonospora sp. WMMD718]UFN93862.1 ABC transporter permease [Micromonospora aurantiaca]SCL41342.1 oligopeptide transport system permease protein [Micromonospora aurantiaca]
MSDPNTASIVSTPPATMPTEAGSGAPTNAGLPESAKQNKPRGLLGDAWIDLRRKPLFWISATIILVFLVMAAFPWLFTSGDAVNGSLDRSRVEPSSAAWFGYDVQGRDVYARVIYGARASIVVAVVSTFLTLLVGGTMGIIAGYRGGWVDALLSRIADIFFGLPFVLGSIVILTTFNGSGSDNGEWTIMGLVIMSLSVLSWPVVMRLMRSSVLATKEADYIVAARALGAGTGRIILKHLLPNCLAPLLVYGTIMVGSFIGAEATLSFLGIGLKSPVVSWGIMISEAQNYIRVSPYLLFFPSAFLVAAVLSFVMLGEAVREALDPKLR